MRNLLTLLTALLTLAMVGGFTQVHAADAGFTVAPDGLCPTTTVLRPGNSRPAYATSQGAQCSSGGGGGSVTQGTSPWVDNITHFGGANVVTGTGASGPGIPRVTVSNDSIISTSPSGYSTTDASSTVATGGTFQTVLALNTSRHGCQVQNPTSATESLFVHYDAGGATTANSLSLGPGSTFSCGSNGIVVTDLISVTAATTGHTFTAKSQ